jgi:DNA repair exonuclease SbcCD ATPase subunit
MEKDVHWLRDHMRDRMANPKGIYQPDNILDLLPTTEDDPGAAALSLISQAAQIIEDFEKAAAEKQARAETLAKKAVERLKIADERVRTAETAQRAIETDFKYLSDQFATHIQEIRQAMEETSSRMAATEAQLTAAEQRAKNAEKRATQAENALRRIEKALGNQIIEKRLNDPKKAAAA